ncbi:hypothetical protein J2T02_004443 [Chitinophaga terrae (ex Kim and Jung 2007)]|uniref:hypothetical protein n=1 Tax=Chitinophaga terrae (ex Kim and Jung 2007) TaxID=408074 RepID=UPI00277E2761|nr:hypothetical protein [Chitinophaga terrae (ex Kim and Jung 2007)]MDQ0109300.1 hypothetical protein [Chitinophaga terrae (ex Kim and Jung 2007)]
MSEHLNKRGPETDDPPSWGNVVAGLLLGIGGAILFYSRYTLFQHTENATAAITRIESLVYQASGKKAIVLLAVYAVISLSGFYLAISNIVRLYKVRSKRDN